MLMFCFPARCLYPFEQSGSHPLTPCPILQGSGPARVQYSRYFSAVCGFLWIRYVYVSQLLNHPAGIAVIFLSAIKIVFCTAD